MSEDELAQCRAAFPAVTWADDPECLNEGEYAAAGSMADGEGHDCADIQIGWFNGDGSRWSACAKNGDVEAYGATLAECLAALRLAILRDGYARLKTAKRIVSLDPKGDAREDLARMLRLVYDAPDASHADLAMMFRGGL